MSDKIRKNDKLWLIPAAAAIAVVLVCAIFVYRGIQNQKEINRDPSKLSGADSESPADTEAPSGTVLWEGKHYRYNDHLSNFLFLGIDKREQEETSLGEANAGQSDSLFLLSWDRVESSITVISIPRDTMTDIEVYGASGQSLGKSRDHISLAYAFGDGKHKSCELSKAAVSNLFYGLPIQGYCAISLDGIPVLTEGVGGVPVRVPDDRLEKVNPQFQEGALVTLDKDNVEVFVRFRDINESQSALYRMERQNIFLEAYAEKARQVFSENPGFIGKLYDAMGPYMVTSMGNDQFAKLMECAVGGGQMQRWTIPGEGTHGKSFDEFLPDDDALYKKIIETFYIEE